MSIGGGGSSGNSQSTTQLDPQVKADWQSLYNMATGTAASGAPQQQVAGFTPTEVAGQNMVVSGAQSGIPSLNTAAGAAAAGTGYQAPSIDMSYQGTPLTTGVDHYGAHDAAAPDSSVIGYSNVDAPQLGDLSTYMNPYTSDVVDTSLQQLDLARQQAINGNSSAATLQGGEGAFNGSRAGVSDALTNQQFGQQASQMIAGLNNTNYQTALGAAQAYGQMGEQAQQANQGAALSAGTTAYQGDLSTALANQGAENSKEQFNAAANNTASEFNAQQALTAEQANATANLQGQGQDLTAAGLLGNLGTAQQTAALTAGNAVTGVGQAQQAQTQQGLNTSYQNQMSSQLLPLQTVESAFGIIPNTGSGSSTTTNSSGKSGQVGI